MMTYSVFKKEVIQLLKQHIKDDDYIKALDKDIKKHYDSQKRVSQILGSNQISANSYVLGILFMYPELP